MADTTPNIGLRKPLESDFVSVDTLNENLEKIDEAHGVLHHELISHRADYERDAIKRDGSVAMTEDFNMGGKNIWNTTNLPCINLIPDSGRFIGTDQEPLALQTTSPFTVSRFFYPHNGTKVESVGKFINNNNDFGGTRGSMTPEVVDFCNALLEIGGRTNLRYGPEFYIGQYTMGSGTDANYGGKNLLTTNNSSAAAGSSGYLTMAFWIRIKSGGSILIRNSGHLYKNGENVIGNLELSPIDGWVQVQIVGHFPHGYSNAVPYIYANAGDVIQIALPFASPGGIGPGVHTAPIPRASLGYTAVNRAGDMMTGSLELSNGANYTFFRATRKPSTVEYRMEMGVSAAGLGFLGRVNDGDTEGLIYIVNGTTIQFNGVNYRNGIGSPEGVIQGNVGDIYTRKDGAATSTFYVKTFGSGNTGWTAK